MNRFQNALTNTFPFNTIRLVYTTNKKNRSKSVSDFRIVRSNWSQDQTCFFTVSAQLQEDRIGFRTCLPKVFQAGNWNGGHP